MLFPLDEKELTSIRRPHGKRPGEDVLFHHVLLKVGSFQDPELVVAGKGD
jgi:hypothetical protein